MIRDALAMARRCLQAGDLAQAGSIVRRVLLADPDGLEALLLMAEVSRMTGDIDGAVAALRRAVAVRPDHASAHLLLGNGLLMQRRLDEAAASYRHALRLRPDYPEACTNLGSVHQEQGRLEDAAACHRRAARGAPGFVDAHYNLANALKELGRVAEAVASYEDALRLRPDFAPARLNLGLARLLLGDLERGWPDYEWRFRCGQPPPRDLPGPRWDGSPPAGRTILLHAEQGFGDVLMFVRYAERLRRLGARVVLECPAALAPLLSSARGVDELVARGSALPAFDAHAALLSVPGLVGTTAATIPAEVPYLAPDPKRRQFWRGELGTLGGLKVGVAWQGDPSYRWDRQRSFALERLAPLAAVEGVRLIGLQKGPGSEQLRDVAGWLDVVDLGGRLDEGIGAFVDTAAVVADLDLVVAPDTAVAHLAGALGVPVWLALPTVPHWPWGLEGDASPWYPTMRLFRQRRPGLWGEVFDRMARELQRLAAARAPAPAVAVEVSLGELVDKITILEIKARRIAGPGKLAHVRDELAALTAARQRAIAPSAEVDRLATELTAVNEALWDVEDELRRLEGTRDFGPRFVELARSVYRHNDHRAALKRRINDALGSRLVEEKSYAS
ncbi:MAG TPA: DUF6165 family protein [Isosphaeraceae bacterium]|jgi:Flp pilus assembly protein TadD